MGGVTGERNQLKPTNKKKGDGGLGRQAGKDRVNWEESPSVQKSGASYTMLENLNNPTIAFLVKPPLPRVYFKLLVKFQNYVAFKACSSDNSQNEIRSFDSV